MSKYEESFPTVISRPHDTMPCPPMLSFMGGDVPLPKPTRADLVLSAKQWAQRMSDELVDRAPGKLTNEDAVVLGGILDRIDAVLAELEAMCR